MRKCEHPDEQYGNEYRPAENYAEEPGSVADAQQDEKSNGPDNANHRGQLRPKLKRAISSAK
jgi:hypothetical protein